MNRIFLFVCILFFTSNCNRRDNTRLVAEIDETLLCEGDLIFRLGRSTSSQIVNFADRERSYSHVGILFRDSLNEWYVIHAVPGERSETEGVERIKRDALLRFWGSDRTVDGVVMRHDSIREILHQISVRAHELYHRKILFDHDYALSDTTRLYCTEFVNRVFLSANIDLSENRRHSFPLIKEEIIFPSDILKNSALKEVCKVKFTELQSF